MPTESSIFDALTAVQQDVLQAFVAGRSISAAAKTSAFTGPPVDPKTPRHSPTLCSPPAHPTTSHSTLFDTF